MRSQSSGGGRWREAEKVPALLLGKDFTFRRMTRSLLGERGRAENFWQKEERECRGVKARMAFWKIAEEVHCGWSLGSVRWTEIEEAIEEYEIRVSRQPLRTLPGHYWDYHYLLRKDAQMLRWNSTRAHHPFIKTQCKASQKDTHRPFSIRGSQCSFVTLLVKTVTPSEH